jgi:formylglycine-generating enzyme required for sulfatase activity
LTAIGRVVTGNSSQDVCATSLGPVPVDAAPWAQNDVTPLGVVGLGGNVHEWLRDGFAEYGDAPWRAAGLRLSLPEQVEAPLRTSRGGDWAGTFPLAVGSARRADPPIARFDNVGFRCARPGR